MRVALLSLFEGQLYFVWFNLEWTDYSLLWNENMEISDNLIGFSRFGDKWFFVSIFLQIWIGIHPVFPLLLVVSWLVCFIILQGQILYILQEEVLTSSPNKVIFTDKALTLYKCVWMCVCVHVRVTVWVCLWVRALAQTINWHTFLQHKRACFPREIWISFCTVSQMI